MKLTIQNSIRLILPVALAFSVTTSGLLAQAQTGNAQPAAKQEHKKGDWKAKKAEMHKRMAQDLGLSKEQQEQIQAIRKAWFESHKDEIAAMKAKRQELMNLKKSGASPEELKAKKEALRQEFSGTRAQHEELMNQIKAVLTPEQVQKMEAMKQRHKQEWQNRKHRGGDKSDS